MQVSILYGIQGSLLPFRTPQMKFTHIFFFKSHLTLSSDLSPGLSSSDLSRFPDENFVGISPMHAACLANLIFIDSVILLLGEEYKL